ncbi:YciI family protein [Actinomycetospora endophytica]|uniref:YciI family protein n=1 Tax=Actinomycetospora endophytica TaxID=2291215 RepID=A0ABS8P9G0_9PSEU|nr:YciI family protein [Actinomycetospora endophytica]MCD2194903.1 YciI family protein [Actinomycetospora endophytica]
MKYVLFYAAAPDAPRTAPAHFPAHQVLLDEFHGRGDLLMVGTFTDLVGRGAMAIFTNAEAAEEFAARDPFVAHGVVASHEVCEWNEVLA